MRIKDLKKTIDQLIKVDPSLEKKLKPIKNKSSRWPRKNKVYWKELLEFLNSDALKNHPKRSEMREVFTPKKSIKKPLYSFEPVLSHDLCVGVIPENIADIIRRHDLRSIKVAKSHVEANMTRNAELLKKVSREEFFIKYKFEKNLVEITRSFQFVG